jgi:hypothetical protein
MYETKIKDRHNHLKLFDSFDYFYVNLALDNQKITPCSDSSLRPAWGTPAPSILV